MRYLHVFVCFLFCFSLFALGRLAALPVAALEDPTLSDPELVLPTEAVAEVQEAVSPSDSVTPVDSVAMLAAINNNDLSGVASWSLSTNLGNIDLYAASDIDSSGIRIQDDGLLNLTNSTVYFYCPQYPEYTFSASRFSGVTYRGTGISGSQTLQVNSVEVLSSDLSDYFRPVALSLLVFVLFFLIWGVFRK